MSTLTPRVKYELDATGQIGVQHANWDRSDYVAGLIYRLSTDPPVDTAILYDGAVVVEKDTGISARYLWNGSGFDKKYVNYPFYYWAQEPGSSFGSGQAPLNGWTQNFTSELINWDTTWQDSTTKGIKIQVKGIYDLRLHVKLDGTFGGSRDLGFRKNGAWQNSYRQVNAVPGGYGTGYFMSNSTRQVFAVNDLIQPYFYNTGGGTYNILCSVECSLVRPVW
jgi:hypothetical protein